MKLSEEILIGLTRLNHKPGGGGSGAKNGSDGDGCVLQLAQAAVGKTDFSCAPDDLRRAIHKRHPWTKDVFVRCPHADCECDERVDGDNLADILIHMNDEHKDDARMMAYMVQKLEQRQEKKAPKQLEAPKEKVPFIPVKKKEKVFA